MTMRQVAGHVGGHLVLGPVRGGGSRAAGGAGVSERVVQVQRVAQAWSGLGLDPHEQPGEARVTVPAEPTPEA